MTESELQMRERNLIREQELWTQKKVDADRELAKLKAEIATLTPKSARLKHECTELKVLIDDKANELAARGDLLRSINKEIASNNKHLGNLQAELRTIGEEINTKRSTIDANIALYKLEKKNEDNERVAIADSQYLNLLNGIEILKTDITDKKEELARLEEDIMDTTEVLAHARHEYHLKVDGFKTKARELESANLVAQTQNDFLTITQGELIAHNSRITKESEEFGKWRQKAMRELETADKALQERETAVEQREQYRPRPKSFLPPTTE